ncbi:TraB/VirB10 family protein [Ramlibacter humi]|uniref:TraB/VirB10 family protein n=1 Tax=Ramlibacter humi TaxID=2530451 RepID=UPI0014304DE2|nr:TraB/VirB10 family protein [Ramlibacter humi]
MTDSKAGPAGTLETPSDVKKKQLFLITIIVIVVMLATFFTTIFSGSKEEPKSAKKEPARKTSIAAPGARVDPKEAWIGAAGDQIASLEKDKRALEDRLQRLEEKEKARDNKPGVPADAFMPPLGAPPPMPAAAQPSRAASAIGTSAQGVPAEPEGASNKIATTMVMGSAADSRPRGGETGQPSTTGGTAAVPATPAVPAAAAAPVPAAKAVDLTREDYIPAGSFFQAVMLSGLDAPTGGQVQANPHPVLLRLLDNAILPNRFRAQVKECFVVAAGYGDMSSERAYLRTESLSCVNRKGQVIDVPIAGWAIGDDGKAGIRGRVVSKQGQAIANAILSGVMAGLGSAIKESSVDTYTGGFGGTSVVQVPRPGKEFRAGVGEGVTKGLDRLTEYYIKLAERIFPVIEVDAGRVVDIALNKGMSMKGLYKADAGDPAQPGDASALSRRQLALRKTAKVPQEQ